ncbi:acyltransferase family protein [Serratia marcescens]|uniref:acyltransferase family protein n=1 Tax=Serratia marcescens TaxID=615 RepID=UPI003FA6B4D9
MAKNLNPWLDLCRASAIFMVMLSHGRGFLIPIIPSAQALKFGGFLGVELFFSLSGFLIGKIIFDKYENSKGTFEWIPSFWFRRWMRTYPSYIVFLILNLSLANSIRPETYPNILEFSTFTQSLLTPHPSFFGEAWSLSVEEVFYFLFPIAISSFFFVCKRKTTSLILAICTIFLLSLALRVNAVTQSQMTFNEVRSTALYRLDSLMIGVIFSWLFLSKKINTVIKLGTLLIPVSVYISSKPDSFMDSSAFLKIFLFYMASIGSACLIVSFYHVSLPSKIKVLTSNMARWSYSAYLINLPVIYTINYYIPKQTSFAGCILMWLLFMTSTITLSKFTYQIFEERVLKLRDRIKSA